MLRNNLDRDQVVQSITRAPTIAGIAYNYLMVVALIATISLTLLKSLILTAILTPLCYFLCRQLTRKDPFLLDIYLAHNRECRRVLNQQYWQARSYEPW